VLLHFRFAQTGLSASQESMSREYLKSCETRFFKRLVDRVERVFREGGTRWVVDFKTSRHEVADIEGFLDSERTRYRNQLGSYSAFQEVQAEACTFR
jgi:hypothetical protein